MRRKRGDDEGQLSMFETGPRGSLYVPESPRELRRNTDPGTSGNAAEQAMRQGRVTASQKRALALVTEWPGLIATELSDRVHDRDPRTIGRRLNELERMGLIRRGPERVYAPTGMRCATWWVVKGDDEGA